MEKVVEVKEVCKEYHGKKIVNHISFSIKKKEFLALLGPNGAGKSTMIAMLCGLVPKTHGDIYICGKRIKDYDQKESVVGVVFQNSVLDDTLTLKRNLVLRCGLYGITKKQAYQRINEIILLCGLEDFINQKVATLSGGQRRKGDIARALIVKPTVLILDEPTTGLDPYSRRQIWDMIEHLKEQSTIAILLTTHYLEEAEKADKIIIMHQGSVIAEGSVTTLKKQFAATTLYIHTPYTDVIKRILKTNKIPFLQTKENIKIALGNRNPISLLTLLEPYIDHFEIRRGTIEEAFLKIMEEI